MTYYPDEYDLERSHELERRLDRDAEREPYAFRRRRFTFSASGIGSPIQSSRVVRPTKRGGRYEPATTPIGCHILPSRVDAQAKRVVDNSGIVDGKKASRSHVGSSQRCAILRREA